MQKIKIQIAGRYYPITVSEGEEIFVRQASKNLDQLISSLESKYSVSDKQDSLAMVALQFATKYEIQQRTINESLLLTNQKVEQLSFLLKESLEVL